VEEITKRLVKRGFEVEVLTVDTTGKLASECVHNGVKVRRFKSWSPRSINEIFFSSWKLWKYLLKNAHRYNIIHAHNYHALPSLYAALTKSSNKFVFTPHYHGAGSYFFRNLLHFPYRVFGWGIFKKADRIICVSKFEKYQVMRKLGVNGEKITVIPNGLDLDQLKGIEKKSKDFRSILYVGRIEKYKGIQFIVKTLPKLSDDIIVEIVGVGPYKTELVKLASTLGIENRIRFYHNLQRKKLLQKYVDADIFMMLSIRESFGITVAEALSLGTPCIVSTHSALREWIDGHNCLGIDYPPDINKLTELITKIIGRTTDYLALRKRIPSWDYVAEKLIKIYRSFEE
jgi:glycosyltransferase involved in cell wall biosynthesis